MQRSAERVSDIREQMERNGDGERGKEEEREKTQEMKEGGEEKTDSLAGQKAEDFRGVTKGKRGIFSNGGYKVLWAHIETEQ